MEYVMVPVPDEYVVDVMQYVARLVARASVVPWTKEGIEAFFEDTEETNRALLSFVARSVVAAKEVGPEDAAEALELNVREIRAITGEINEAANRNKYEPLIASRETEVQLRNGRTVQRRVYTMKEQVARMIRAYERAFVAQVDSPATTSE